jgi:hypothetical protein
MNLNNKVWRNKEYGKKRAAYRGYSKSSQ